MEEPNVPLLPGVRHFFELPSGEFIKIDLRDDANGNGQWVVEHLDETGELAGLVSATFKSQSTERITNDTHQDCAKLRGVSLLFFARNGGVLRARRYR